MRNFHPTNERTIRFSLRVSASFDVFDAIVLRWGFAQRSNNFEFYRACIRWRVRGQIVRRELTNDMRRNFEKENVTKTSSAKRISNGNTPLSLMSSFGRLLKQEFDIVSNSVDY